MGRRQPSYPTLSRLLMRPYALAHRAEEWPVAAACAVALLLVFVGDMVTPMQVAFSALGLIPLMAAMWLLSARPALAVASLAVGQLLVTGAIGALSLPTVASEGAAYVLLAVVCRLYARSLRDLLSGKSRSGRGIESLTAREQQVTRLAARGYTARQIGNELNIGRRTVETHLVNAYNKLGVQSKRELIRTVSKIGVWPPSGV